MNDYYEKCVQLSMRLCKAEDYIDKKRVRVHNAAMGKLLKLEKEMIKTDCSGDFAELLRHEDERVRLNAAAMCLRHGLMCDAAEQTLTELTKCSDNTIAFSANMLLKDVASNEERC